MRMPEPDAAMIAPPRRDRRRARATSLPAEGVIVQEDERRAYESDGLTAYRQSPLVVVLPSTTAEVARVLRYCHERRLKVVPRGAGTSLSGGALPLADGIVLGMGKFNRILEIDYANRCAVVQPGVTNLGISNAVAACRLLLRARSVEPDRLHHRRQCRGEFGRRALPQIRPHHQQRARRRAGADRRRGGAAGRQASRCRGLRPAGHDDRLGRAAGRRHRGDGAHPAQADHGARRADRLSRRTRAPAIASPRSSPPASSPAAWR